MNEHVTENVLILSEPLRCLSHGVPSKLKMARFLTWSSQSGVIFLSSTVSGNCIPDMLFFITVIQIVRLNNEEFSGNQMRL